VPGRNVEIARLDLGVEGSVAEPFSMAEVAHRARAHLASPRSVARKLRRGPCAASGSASTIPTPVRSPRSSDPDAPVARRVPSSRSRPSSCSPHPAEIGRSAGRTSFPSGSHRRRSGRRAGLRASGRQVAGQRRRLARARDDPLRPRPRRRTSPAPGGAAGETRPRCR
jgi:hypothetical protein